MITVSTGEATALEEGSAGISATMSSGVPEYSARFCAGTACPTGGQGASITGSTHDATPVITNLSTTTFPVNQATTVTIRGQDFGTNTPALDLPFLGTYTLIGTPTDTQIVASIAPSAVGGGDLGVTAGGFNGQSFEGEGMGSPQGNSTKPVVSFQIVPPAANAILTGNDPAVIAANIYQVIAPMPGTGSVTAVSSQSSDTFAPFAGPPPGTTVTTTDLDVNGQFQDNIINCSNKPITGCNLTTIPSISVGGLSVRNNQLVWSSTGVAYTSKGPNPK